VGTEHSQVNEKVYSEKALVMSKGFVAYALSHEDGALQDVIEWVYRSNGGPQLLQLVIEESRELLQQNQAKQGQEQSEGNRERVSAGALIILRRHYDFLASLGKDRADV